MNNSYAENKIGLKFDKTIIQVYEHQVLIYESSNQCHLSTMM